MNKTVTFTKEEQDVVVEALGVYIISMIKALATGGEDADEINKKTDILEGVIKKVVDVEDEE